MEKQCEVCGAKPKGEYNLLDYCAECSADLCDECMAKGHCGNVPAISGRHEDAAADDERPRDEAGGADPLYGQRIDSADMGEN